MKTLIMVPAMGCDRGLYVEQARGLGDIVSLQTIIADGDRLEACVEQILAAAPERFVILGTSFGGRVALETALAAPDRVEGLVVIGASAGPSPNPAAGLERSRRLRSAEFNQVVEEMANMIAHLPGPLGPEARREFIRMAEAQGGELMARQSDALAHRANLVPRLGEIACPALMLWGVEDRFVSWQDGLKMAAACPHARFVEIKDCGHFPTLEAPEETNDAIRHWLAANGLGDDKSP
ncbi:MAG: alpha/beta hydrolase [Rhizobiales bacterium]|nr:alpha/beta hydrolase [Hyphomicrobiales bacterium]